MDEIATELEKTIPDIYYKGTTIFNTKDLDGEEPAIYIISGNRSAGKTSYFLMYSLTIFKQKKRKTILLYRYQYELSSAPKIYEDLLRIYKFGEEMQATPQAKGLFYELFLDGVSFGYAVCLNNVDALKKYSPLFAEVDVVIMDEFQTESGKYLKKEIEKFQSIMLSVMRGGGELSRQIKIFLLGNNVTLMNPYFIEFGIHKRLRNNTKIMRGSGWVAQFFFNAHASNAIKNNAFSKAFRNSSYIDYSTENIYLIDTECFIEKPKGKNKYIFTISHNGAMYGVRDFYEDCFLYISEKVDPKCTTILTFKAKNHTQNTVMINHHSYIWSNIRESYQAGILKFDNLKTKNAIFDILAIDLYK